MGPLRSRLCEVLRPVRLDEPVTTGFVGRGLLATLGLVSQGVSRVLTMLLIGRLGGPAALGLVVGTVSAAQIVNLVWPASIGSAAAKFVAQARGRHDSQATAAIAAHLARRTATSASVLSALAALVWVLLLDRDALTGALVALLILGYAGQSLGSGVHYAVGRVARLTQWDVVVSLLGFAGVTVLILVNASPLALLLPLALAALVQTFACWPWSASGRPGRAQRREMDVFVTIATVGTLASSGFHQMSILAAGAVAGTVGVGNYASVLVVATPLLILTSSLSLVLFPTLAEAVGRADEASVRQQVDLATRALVLIMVSVIAALVLGRRSVMAVVWGPAFRTDDGLFLLVMGAVLVSAIAVPSVNFLSNHSQRGAAFGTTVSVIGLCTGALFWVWAGPMWGVTGIAAGYFLGKSFFTIVVMAVTDRRLILGWSGLVWRLPSAGLTIIVAALLQVSYALPLWTDPLLGLVAIAGWCLISIPDIRAANVLLRRRRGSMRDL